MATLNNKSLSKLPIAKSIENLYTLGTDKNNNSVKVPIELLKGNKGDKGRDGTIRIWENKSYTSDLVLTENDPTRILSQKLDTQGLSSVLITAPEGYYIRAVVAISGSVIRKAVWGNLTNIVTVSLNNEDAIQVVVSKSNLESSIETIEGRLIKINEYSAAGRLDMVETHKPNKEMVSQWLDNYIPVGFLDENINVTLRAVKDIWFDFPDNVIPDWFKDRKPLLRSISNNRYLANEGSNLLRISFIKNNDIAYDDAYTINYQSTAALGGWGVNGIVQNRVQATIQGTKIGVNFIVDGDELMNFPRENGIIFTPLESITLKPYIKPRTTTSVFSQGRLSYGVNSKTVLTGSLNKTEYIEFNTSTYELTIPDNTRIILSNGAITSISKGTYLIEKAPLTGAAVYFIYVNILTGAVEWMEHTELSNIDNRKYWDENQYIYIGTTFAHLRGAIFKTENYKVDGKIKEIDPTLIAHDILPLTVPQIVNNQIQRKDISKPLRMMCFGSSWFMNTWWYLNKIIKSAGIDTELVCFYTGGAYFSQWNERFDNDTSVDCWKSVNGSDWTQTTAKFKTTLLEGWDIIAFQQGAFQAIDWNGEWPTEWSNLVSKVKRCCEVDTVIAFNSTWTPAVSGILTPYPNTTAGQKQWQQDNYKNTRRFMTLSGISNVSPNGATMWVMRRNAQLNVSNDLATDNLHPNNGLPMYGLAGTYFETFIAPTYGVSFDSVDWMPDINTQKAIVSGTNWTSINPNQRDIIRQIIKLSLSDRFGFREL